MNPRFRVFIGSSTEGKRVAEHLQWALNDTCDAVVWDQGVVEPGNTTLRALHAAAAEFDFAAFVVTPDDMVNKRDRLSAAPRDNVVLEVGLFSGILGPERTFIVQPHEVQLSLPSDLAGVAVAMWRPRADGNLRAALKPVALELHEAMTRIVNRALVKASGEADEALARTSAEIREVRDALAHNYEELERRLRELESRVQPSDGGPALSELLEALQRLDVGFARDVGVGLGALKVLQGRPLEVSVDFSEVYRYIHWPHETGRTTGYTLHAFRSERPLYLLPGAMLELSEYVLHARTFRLDKALARRRLLASGSEAVAVAGEHDPLRRLKDLFKWRVLQRWPKIPLDEIVARAALFESELQKVRRDAPRPNHADALNLAAVSYLRELPDTELHRRRLVVHLSEAASMILISEAVVQPVQLAMLDAVERTSCPLPVSVDAASNMLRTLPQKVQQWVRDAPHLRRGETGAMTDEIKATVAALEDAQAAAAALHNLVRNAEEEELRLRPLHRPPVTFEQEWRRIAKTIDDLIAYLTGPGPVDY